MERKSINTNSIQLCQCWLSHWDNHMKMCNYRLGTIMYQVSNKFLFSGVDLIFLISFYRGFRWTLVDVNIAIKKPVAGCGFWECRGFFRFLISRNLAWIPAAEYPSFFFLSVRFICVCRSHPVARISLEKDSCLYRGFFFSFSYRLWIE